MRWLNNRILLRKRFKMNRRLKQTIIGASAAAILCIIVLVVVLVKKFTPSKEKIELTDYYTVPEGQAMVFLDDTLYEKNARVVDGRVYFDLDTVIKYFGDRFYWDSGENLLIYTTPVAIIKAQTGEKSYLVNKARTETNYVVVKTDGGQVYIAADFMEEYTGLSFQLYEEPYRVIVDYEYKDYLYLDVTKATQLRTASSIKDPILKELVIGDKLMLIDNGGIQENGFLKVMTEDGIRGFVKKKCLGESYYEKKKTEWEKPQYSHISKNGTINLVWHQVTNQEANGSLATLIAGTKGVTVISPTWFRVNSEEGTLTSLASENYVQLAHNMGLEVWALFDNFDSTVNSYQLLSHSSSRERLVNEIIAAAIRYNLDGINIDFESLNQETGPHFIQFLRELSVKCRINHIVLSADNPVPAPYSQFYDREEQGEILDYVIIMGYDEHHSRSETAGSVASINFIKEAIENSLTMVPAQRLIMGIPFYTRLWKTTTENGVSTLTSEALGMENAEKTLSSNGAVPEWDEVTKQYYVEYTKTGNILYQIWLEEERSIEEKMKLIYEANLAGVAGWRLGFEKSTIWDVILKYIN